VSNSFKVCPTHFCRGAKIFLASYGSGFAPWYCVDRKATFEAWKWTFICCCCDWQRCKLVQQCVNVWEKGTIGVSL